MVKSYLILYPFFCFLSFFALHSNVRWRNVLKQTIMLLRFTFLILLKYDLPIRWALSRISRIESRISKFDSSFHFSFLRAHHSKFLCLLMVLHLFSNKVCYWIDLFFHKKIQWLYSTFFNSLICSWRKLLSWQSWWILPSRLPLILLISSFKISLNFSVASLLNVALG